MTGILNVMLRCTGKEMTAGTGRDPKDGAYIYTLTSSDMKHPNYSVKIASNDANLFTVGETYPLLSNADAVALTDRLDLKRVFDLLSNEECDCAWHTSARLRRAEQEAFEAAKAASGQAPEQAVTTPAEPEPNLDERIDAVAVDGLFDPNQLLIESDNTLGSFTVEPKDA